MNCATTVYVISKSMRTPKPLLMMKPWLLIPMPYVYIIPQNFTLSFLRSFFLLFFRLWNNIRKTIRSKLYCKKTISIKYIIAKWNIKHDKMPGKNMKIKKLIYNLCFRQKRRKNKRNETEAEKFVYLSNITRLDND